jgi:hypothetical protein
MKQCSTPTSTTGMCGSQMISSPSGRRGPGRVIHISNFICETIRPIKLSEEQIKDQLSLPDALSLPAFEARTITYPGKGFDSWWDLAQLIKQLKNMIVIFEYTHSNCKGVFVFDRSSAHEGYAEDALNINNMNINPGGKQKKMHDTMIPRSNPDPAPGEEDTRGQIQKMCFPDSHNDPDLCRKAKGMRAVLQEWKSVWDKLISASKACGEMKIVGKCSSCAKSQVKKDAERHIALAESMGQDDAVLHEDITHADMEAPSIGEDRWCCMYHVLALQEDFQLERLLIQTIIENAEHVCLFLPRFHCELNAIKMLWGYAKYHACTPYNSHVHCTLNWPGIQDIMVQQTEDSSLQSFLSHSALMLAVSSRYTNSSRRHGDILMHISECFRVRACICVCVRLDRLDNPTSRKGLNACQAAFANKKYKSHRRVGLPSDITACLAAKDDPEHS